MTYLEQLATPEWKALRERLIKERGFRCEDCGIESDFYSDFDLHHKYYESRRMSWLYPDDCFKVLCRTCHEGTTEGLKSLLYTFGYFDSGQIVQIGNAIQIAIVEGNEASTVATLIEAVLSDTRRVRIEYDKEVENAG